MVLFISGILVGSTFGVLMMGIMVASSRENQQVDL